MNTLDEIRSLWKAIADLNIRLAGVRKHGSPVTALNDLSDVSLAAPADDEFLRHNGVAWVNEAVSIVNNLNDLADVDAGAPADTQVLTWVNATGKWEAKAAAGAGTFIGLADTPGAFEYGHVWGNIAKTALLFSGNKHPDIPPTVPENEDDEFNNEAIDVKWTITNDPAGANAISESAYPGNIYVGLIEHVAADNFDSLIRFHQTPPAGNQTLEFQAKVSLAQTGLGGNIAEWATIGIYFGDSVNDEYISIEIQFNDSWAAQYSARAQGGEDNGAGGMSSMANLSLQQVIPSEWIYLRLVKTTANAYNAGNTYRAYFSLNGLIWFESGWDTKTFTANCDEVGIYFRRPKAQVNTPHCEAIVDWFRRMD